MVETRFPSSGLSAEYGDIVISEVTVDAVVTVRNSGTIILSESYTPDANDQITIKGIGELAMLYFAPGNLLTATGEDASPVGLTVDVVAGTTISKVVTIYPSVVDFAGTLDAATLLQIPLSRATKKNTAPGRKEYISFYANGNTLVAYIVYKGATRDMAVSYDFYEMDSVNAMCVVDVSPSVMAALAGVAESDLVYYNVYTSAESIIRFMVSSRSWQFEKTFVFRNCFGAQESFTCTGDEISDRKWTREYGDFEHKKTDFSRDLENSIKINSGYLTAREIEVVEDMLNADELYLIDEAGFQKITILDEDFSDTSRKDELNSVTFTYRYAQHNQFKSRYEAFKKPRIFTPDFDTSFE